ncbi:hypothetical protein [Alteriqipengyuania lutimaris]|uniref:DUF3106 domain-containing protein n=1 Tax=Alteriqipengyuania lutimaris TaxID=1538146 RepID=A0A395LGV3_9SPHN|nr:hypothetical protein [Alteriqipengyuania lutimaris]MBB3035217.1 hypothetical protein [Alteriqipengyuania lutimaris]RDS75819.1 hypothetical protein DL238_14105 [Alteriqipengyuania lutimaris]
MKKLILATTAACGMALAAVPALADHHNEAESYMMTDAQEAMYMDWSAENRMTYQEWPIAAQEYYWTLNESQQKIWWDSLNDEQRVRIVEMAPAQRTAAWQSINTQLSGTTTATTTTRSTMSGGATINYSSNAVVQPTPGDEGPPTGDLPICEPMEQDNCINRGAV